MKKLLFVGIMLLTLTREGQAQIPVIDGANLGQNVEQVLKSIIQINNQLRQIENMIQNTTQGATPWTSALPLLMQLGQTLQRGQSLGYSIQGVDQIFLTTFPGYRSPPNWPQQYNQWTTTSLDTLRSVLGSLGIHADNFVWDAARMATLQLGNASATGRLAAIQAGNAISLEAIGQMQGLKQIAMSQTNAYLTVEANRINQEAQKEAWTREWLLSGQGPVPTYAPTERLHVPRP